MLEVQKYLQSKDKHAALTELESELGVFHTLHPTQPLVILNYSQLESPRNNPITRECRSLVLNTDDWSVVAKSFYRFFNWGEFEEEMQLFNFSNFCTHTKEDGSLILIYFWNGSWYINTRATFGTDVMPFQTFSWRQGILNASGLTEENLDKVLDRRIAYVCEFCSPWNKIVRQYDPCVYLLSAFEGTRELSADECEALNAPFPMPQRFHFQSVDDVVKHIEQVAQNDKTYEGVIMRDDKNQRWKIKSPYYLALHRLRGEDGNLYNPKYLLPFILSGDVEELFTYYPEVKDTYASYENRVQELYQQLENLCEATQGIELQKDFALAIKDKSPFISLLFTARLKFGTLIPVTELKKLWRETMESQILKFLRHERRDELQKLAQIFSDRDPSSLEGFRDTPSSEWDESKKISLNS